MSESRDPQSLNPDRLRRIAAVLEIALELPAELRAQYVGALAHEDADLAARLASMLERRDGPSTFGSSFDLAESVPDESQPATAVSKGTPTDAAEPEDADSIGPYRIVERLGAGGMGVVFLAERADDTFHRSVAIKVIRRGFEDEETRWRFLAERQILAAFDHPNIARMYEGGSTEDGRPYFVMEHVDGLRIDEYCYRKKLSVRRRLELFLQVCSAVEYAHRHLVIHRDLKPSNVLVTDDGVVKLLDFGVAKLLAPEMVSLGGEVTATRLGPMTPHYASPEQIRGERITTVSDVYSLGVLLFNMLTGKLPIELKSFNYQELVAAFDKTRTKPPSRMLNEPGNELWVESYSVSRASSLRGTKPQQLERLLQGDVDNITLTALHKDPTRRYRSPELLARDIELHLSGYAISARPDSALYLIGKFVNRHRLSLTLLGLILSTIAGLTYAAVDQARQADRQRNAALAAQVEAESAGDVERELAGFLVEVFEVADPEASLASTLTARELLERQVDRIRGNVGADPLIQARFKEALGKAFEKLGMLEQAERLLLESLETRRRELGDRHLEVARNFRTLGTIYSEQGRYSDAEQALHRALWTLKLHVADSDPEVAGCRYDLGKLNFDKGEAGLALGFLIQGTEVANAPGSQVDRKLAVNLNNLLGLVYRNLGRYENAELALTEALRSGQRALGPDHPVVANILGNLGSVLTHLGSFDEADSRFREAIAINSKIGSGKEGKTLGLLLFFQANNRRLQGDFEAAENLFLDSLSYHRSEKMAVYNVFNALGAVKVAAGDMTAASEYFEQALKDLQGSPNRNRHFESDLMNNLGVVSVLSGNLDKGLEWYAQVLDLRMEIQGEGLAVSALLSNIGQAQTLAGRYEEAERAFKESERMIEDLDPTPIVVTDLFKGYAVFLQEVGRFESAEKYFLKAIELWQQHHDEGHPGFQEDLKLYADFLREQGRAEEAAAVDARIPAD